MAVDPQINGLLQMIEAAGAPALADGTPTQAREGFRLMTVGMRDPATLATVRSVEDVALPGPAGPVPIRVYWPDVDGVLPTVVFFHGGGFVIGDLDTHDDHARLLCHDVGAVVVSVDYRLAPEHPFPAGFQDCLAALHHVNDRAGQYGGDPRRIAVAGDSAGGNMSAAVALAARDEGLALAAQLLLYPAVDFDEDAPHVSRLDNATGFFLTESDMRWFGEQYLSDAAHRSDPRASGLLADLSGVAPAVIATAEFDPLRDEGEAYAAALTKAGVPVVARRYDGMIHGFFGLGHLSDAARAANAELCADLKALLA